MTMTRKLLSLALAAVMLLCAIPAFAEETDPWAGIDMGGATITIAYNWDYVPATSDYEYNPETDGAGVLTDLEAMKYVEEKYNCRVQRINLPWDQRIERITTSVMTGEPVADLILLDLQQILPLAAQGLLLPLNDFVPETADVFTEGDTLISGGKLLGKDYALLQSTAATTGYFLGVNLELIDDLGLENPAELYAKGEWTWDKLEEICRAATRDTDGDGQNDVFGLSGAPYEVAFQLIAANDGYMASAENRRQGLDDPRTMEALNFFNKLYTEEKVAYIANNDIDDWNGNRFGYTEGKSALFLCQDWLLGTAPSFEFTIVPFPVGPANTSGKTFSTVVNGACIPKSCANPLWAYIVYEELTGYTTHEERSEGTIEWLGTMYLTEEDVMMSVEICGTQAAYEDCTGFANFPNYDLIKSILVDGNTPAQAVEQYKQVAQDCIDEFFRSLEE